MLAPVQLEEKILFLVELTCECFLLVGKGLKHNRPGFYLEEATMKKLSDMTAEQRQKVSDELATPDPVDTSAVRVLYYGHSFVNHFIKWEKRHDEYQNLGFAADDVCVFYHGDGGATLQNLLQDINLEHVERIAPEVVIVEAGTNDLFNGVFGPQTTERQTEALIRELNDRRVRFVVINQVLFRGEAAYKELPKAERKMAKRQFQCQAVCYNLECAKRLKSRPNVMFKKHPGLWKDIDSLVNKRGVHLNDEGHFKLYNSLRSAVIRVKKIIRPAKYLQPAAELAN